jgi:hypothetical protein
MGAPQQKWKLPPNKKPYSVRGDEDRCPSAVEAGSSLSIGGSSTAFRNCPSEAIGREVKVGVLADAVFVRFTQ